MAVVKFIENLNVIENWTFPEKTCYFNANFTAASACISVVSKS